MVAARFDFLSAGHYQPLADAVAELAAAALGGVAAQRPGTVLDAGTGTGHYLRALLDRLALDTTPVEAIGLDISKFALRRAARLNPDALNVVSDVWQPLPVADDAVDVVTVVFAPRNAAEFARVLRPGGRLVVVTPRPGHLGEVAGRAGLLGIDPAKDERLACLARGALRGALRREPGRPPLADPGRRRPAGPHGPCRTPPGPRSPGVPHGQDFRRGPACRPGSGSVFSSPAADPPACPEITTWPLSPADFRGPPLALPFGLGWNHSY